MHKYLRKYFEDIKKLEKKFPIRNMRPLSIVSPPPPPPGGYGGFFGSSSGSAYKIYTIESLSELLNAIRNLTLQMGDCLSRPVDVMFGSMVGFSAEL